MKLKNLEMMLQRLSGFSKPRAVLEQYQTPAPLAARLLFHALMKGDIEGKTVCDLGCGTGILAIGAALLGAASVRGIEIDKDAIRIAQENAQLLSVDVEFINADINTAVGGIAPCDTVVMNPPFGAQKQNVHADRPFIDAALALAPKTYGIFNAGSTPFVEAYIGDKGRVVGKISGTFTIKRTFAFHTRDAQEIPVDILMIVQNEIVRSAA